MTNGCDSSTVFINVTFNQQPTVTSNFSDTTVCEDDTITIYGIGATSYIWNNNIIDSVPIIGPDEGTYSLQEQIQLIVQIITSLH